MSRFNTCSYIEIRVKAYLPPFSNNIKLAIIKPPQS